MDALTGQQLGPYQIVEALGEGGMASVYKAYQPRMERYVALKILPRYYAQDEEFVGRFTQEARVIANLQHPHILAVHDFGEAEGYTYLVMPLVEGGTLAERLHPAQPLGLEEVKRLITQVGDALDYAHSRGVIHRDVKPSNILLDERGNALLSDFGLAKMVESSQHFTQSGGILGTPAYMSPEQCMGQSLDRRTDIYSLGVVLYQMVTGRPPYQAETPVALLLKHAHDPLPPPRQHNSTLTPEIEAVVLKALAKKPEDRFQTASDMVAAMNQAVAGGEPAAVPAPTPPITPPPAPGAPVPRSREAATVPPTVATSESVLVSPSPKTSSPQTAGRRPATGSRPRWLWSGLAGIALIGLLLVAAFLLTRGGDEPVPEQVPFAAVAATEAPATAALPDDEGDTVLPRLVRDAQAAFSAGEFTRAQGLLDEAIAQAPERAELFCLRGRVLEDAGDPAAAEPDYQHCLALAEEQGLEEWQGEAQASLALLGGWRLLDEDRPEEALALLEETGNLSGIPPRYRCERGELALQIGAYELAIEDFSACKARVQDPLWQERAAVAAAEARGYQARENGDLGAALIAFREWGRLAPHEPYPFCETGDVLLEQGRLDEAVPAYQRCTENSPDPGTKQWAEGNILYIEAQQARERGEWGAAIERYDRMLEMNEEAYLFCERSEVFLEMGAWEEARADAGRCLEGDEGLRDWAEELMQMAEARRQP